MSNKDLLFEIAKHASIVEMHIQRLKKKPDDIHEMDIDMLAEKLKDLYSLVFELETGKSIKEIPDAPVVTVVEKTPLVEVKPEPEVPSPKAPEMITNTEEPPKPDPEPEAQRPTPEAQSPTPEAQRPELNAQRPMPEAQSPEPDPEPNPTPDAQFPEPDPTPSAQRQEPNAQSPEPEVPKTTADLFTGATTIADSFQSTEDKSIAARVIPQAIEDLKMAIGINDKFLFINELFKGSPSEYNEAIEKLNTSGELPDAETNLNTYKSQYEWSDQSEAYNRLKKIVHAKYMTS